MIITVDQVIGFSLGVFMVLGVAVGMVCYEIGYKTCKIDMYETMIKEGLSEQENA